MPLPTTHPRIFQVQKSPPIPRFHQRLQTLYHLAERNEPEQVRSCLRELLPGYHPLVPVIPAQAAPYPDDY